ncbi:MAG: hypothetical protein HDT33_02655 [Clostridiales bacterium]|nr:hypothetical protein [Clostridiales bacterium]
MPSLTHVCMFSKHGWERTTVTEAAKIFPETVSAISGIFMCELCHQYVYFSKQGYQIRHFGHTPDADKSCPERTFGPSKSIDYYEREHDLPIRITLLQSDFEFELGLLGVPLPVLNNLQDQMIKITLSQESKAIFSYSLKERLHENEITYVSVGRIPSAEYLIGLDCKSHLAFSCWPKRVQGISSTGTLFDISSRKKLPYDADVQVGKPYYLLTAGCIVRTCKSISLTRLFTKTSYGKVWYIYTVIANALDDDSAKFFLNLHCRLTDRPVKIQPIWPIYIRSPYVIHCNSHKMTFHVQGEGIQTKCFPSVSHQYRYSVENGTVERIVCNDRQQLISAGRTKMLKYIYFWREPLNYTTKIPSVSVTDVAGHVIQPGVADRLPSKGIMRVHTPYDGIAIIKKVGQILEKRRLKAGIPSEIDSLQFGYKVEILQGLDHVWSIQYQREALQSAQEEGPLLQKLKSGTGHPIQVPHSWGAVAVKLDLYPQIKQWLYLRIREGHIPESSYQEFKHFIDSLSAR